MVTSRLKGPCNPLVPSELLPYFIKFLTAYRLCVVGLKLHLSLKSADFKTQHIVQTILSNTKVCNIQCSFTYKLPVVCVFFFKKNDVLMSELITCRWSGTAITGEGGRKAQYTCQGKMDFD